MSLEQIRDAQIFKDDIFERIEKGTIASDEIDILLPSLEARITGKHPIAGVSYLLIFFTFILCVIGIQLGNKRKTVICRSRCIGLHSSKFSH